VTADDVRRLAAECGFELAGVTAAAPVADHARYADWVERGMAGRMGYLTDHRATLRADPGNLLPTARSVICVGKLYNTPRPYSTEFAGEELAWISRYAWGEDYHPLLRAGLATLAARLGTDHEWRVCVDTAPLLERSLARDAGLGWIGRNTCLINQQAGSWFFLGELLTSLEIEPDAPPADRCGTCTRCIEACPTQALTPYELDASRCIAYLTIELRGPIEERLRGAMGANVFGCDICQDVCPWNRRAPSTTEPAFEGRNAAPPLERLALLTEAEFQKMFRGTPLPRAKYTGFLRNVAVAIGNSGNPRLAPVLERLASSGDSVVAEHARWALTQIEMASHALQ
jgi:epoxyqueuosine reductase